MSATYRCAACQAAWQEDLEPTDCPRCGSRTIERAGQFEPLIVDHYAAPMAPIFARSSISSTSFTVTYWLGLVGLVVGIVIVEASGDETDAIAIGGILLFVASAICFFAAFIASLVKIYRAWDLIQPLRQLDWTENEMTTPGSAVGRLFVPVYNLYWTFRAIHGLATKANKYMVLSGIRGRSMNEGLAQAYCILNVCSAIPFVYLLTGLPTIVIYYLVILDVDKMRAGVRAWQEGGEKPDLVDEFRAP
jgi:hypothetical protein